MAWKRIVKGSKSIWVCSKYSDLQYRHITNLAQWGQPYDPYEAGFDHGFDPDFANVIVRMPHRAVMNNGYGKLIKPKHFPVISKFLNGEIAPKANGFYSFAQLLAQKLVDKDDLRIHGQHQLAGFIKTKKPAVDGG